MDPPLVASNLANSAAATPAEFSPQDLARRTLERRAVEAVIWGMPAVNTELMFQAARDARGDFNQVVYWSRSAQAGGTKSVPVTADNFLRAESDADGSSKIPEARPAG